MAKHRSAHIGFSLIFVLATSPIAGAADPLPQAPGFASTRLPNIVLILADDLGFSDLGCYGSEISTPNIDRLAKGGLRFTQFYNCGRCCPTRAALMTGLDPHQAGVGHMMDDRHKPGYRGNLNDRCATIAELLRAAGYQTMICGKWHVSRYTAPEGPKHNWPLQRGFDKFYGTIAGGGSYFDPVTLTRDNNFVRAAGDKFYYTDAISEQAAAYIEQAARSLKPFFLYVAYTAPHWPLQAPDDAIAAYRAKYAAGWDEVRKQRYQRMINLGIIKPAWQLTPREPAVRDWEKNAYKAWQQRRMEVYAAQIDRMDRGVGRIMEKVRQVGVERNTLVLFLSDNGGCAEEIAAEWKGEHIPKQTHDGRSVEVGNNPNLMPGREETYQSYGIAWANVSNTPFRLYKHWIHEGGIATPLVAYWPDGIKPKGLTGEIGCVTDVMATCLEIAKTRYPANFGGHTLIPTEGKSLLPILQGRSRQRGTLCWEHEGNRAVREGKWKLVARNGQPWELYDMDADRTELHDLAGQFPVIVKDMSKTYEQWARRSNVEP